MMDSTVAQKGVEPGTHVLRNDPPITGMNGAAKHPSPTSRQKQRVTVFLPAPLIERLRNAVYWTQHRPLAQIIAHAIEEAVTEMEHANGGVFPPRLAPLKPGRPRRTRVSAPSPAPIPIASERT